MRRRREEGEQRESRERAEGEQRKSRVRDEGEQRESRGRTEGEMREGRGRAEGGRMMVCGERKEVMMWQLMLAVRQSQCVGNWTCAFSTHSSALHSWLHHFFWMKYYDLYIKIKLKSRAFQWYNFQKNKCT